MQARLRAPSEQRQLKSHPQREETGTHDPIVFVGSVTYDAISLVPRYPGPDERVEATELVFGGGGPAATAAVAARRLGAAVLLIGPIGDDPVGELARADLERYGVATEYLQVEPARASQASAIVCASDRSTRAISTLGVGPFTLDAERAEIIRAARWVHVDHLGWPAVEHALAGVPDDRRPNISVDPGNRLIGRGMTCDAARTGLYVPPLKNLADSGKDEEDLVRRVGAARVVATKGADGAIGVDTRGEIHRVAGHRIADFGSTLGAGDVFHGALVAAVAAGDCLLQAMRVANAVAALSCRGIDGRSRIPDRAETNRFLAAVTADPSSKEAMQ